VSRRIDKTWVVLESLEGEHGLRCVDIFRRPDGTFGYEEFRRDPEDQGAWTPVGFSAGLSFADATQARAAAARTVTWLGDGGRQTD
jgi:hypothetical protein